MRNDCAKRYLEEAHINRVYDGLFSKRDEFFTPGLIEELDKNDTLLHDYLKCLAARPKENELRKKNEFSIDFMSALFQANSIELKRSGHPDKYRILLKRKYMRSAARRTVLNVVQFGAHLKLTGERSRSPTRKRVSDGSDSGSVFRLKTAEAEFSSARQFRDILVERLTGGNEEEQVTKLMSDLFRLIEETETYPGLRALLMTVCPAMPYLLAKAKELGCELRRSTDNALFELALEACVTIGVAYHLD